MIEENGQNKHSIQNYIINIVLSAAWPGGLEHRFYGDRVITIA